MPKYTVQCGFADYNSNVVTVEADTIEEACAKAIEAAGQDSCWKRLDDAGPVYVDAIAEGEDVDPWQEGASLEVPFQFTEDGVMERNRPSLIRKFLDISTAHLTPETREALGPSKEDEPGQDTGDFGGTVYACDYGWFIHVPSDPEMDIGKPDDLRSVLAKARALGCDYVLLDRDALYDPTLPTYGDD